MRTNESTSGTVRASIVLMICTTLSRLLGFVRVGVVAAVFGASGKADVLNAVFNIPNNLRKLMAEGALSSAFIPVLTQTHQQDPSGRISRRLMSTILGFQIIVLVPLIAAGIAGAKAIVPVLLDFPDPGKMALSISLFRWFLPYTFLVSISAVLMGTLNSHQRFFIPAVTPLLFSLSVIGCILLAGNRLDVYAMALGVLIGGMMQILFQIPSIVKRGYSLIPNLHFHDPPFREVLRLWGPIVASSSLLVIDQQVAILFASGLEDGSTSALTNAIVFWQLPFGIFSASINTAFFPRFAQDALDRKKTALRSSVEQGLLALGFFLLPASIAMGVLSHDIISAALQRGAFLSSHTEMTAQVLRAYLPGMFFVGSFNLLQRVSYSQGESVRPFMLVLLVVALDILLSLVLKETSLRVAGLALAHSLSFLTGSILLFLTTTRELEGFPSSQFTRELGKIVAALIPFGIVLLGIRGFLGDRWREGSSFSYFLLVALLIIGSAMLILLMYRLFRVDLSKRIPLRRNR
ncbi:murein biosynthesis integral membrane protein MurJ [Spirochaeta thermophila]|uniref:Probable lipid II flippase MurJ n=1 Tax=Winmispira thermophila (strain ATCC 49972 / DSM 6192 / RI 19.B1) TaxID=665571 RepID=E0RSR7_WINT6|nr:murein biosynthesis integral membrane protein MurJ [Spirochaeta thermophila]ADN02054.1 virulence factor MviN [Spirochaeta thermophila DSM 6192]